MNWKKGLENLVFWAHSKNYHVEFIKDGDDCICYISKLIEINSSSPAKTQVIRLLHECGHVLIFENGSPYDFEGKRNLPSNSEVSRVFNVLEEIEAWKRGWELSGRLDIKIEKTDWEKAMASALMKYFNWAVLGEKYENKS